MAYNRPTTMYDAMISGLNNLGSVGTAITNAKAQQSELKTAAQQQKINAQVIAKNDETAASALARKQLLGSLEDAGSMTPGATTGTGPNNAVNMDEIKAA